MIGPNCENLVFLVSQPRSGSTLLQRILGSHTGVHTLPEPWIILPLLSTIRPELVTAKYDATLAEKARQDFVSHLPNGDTDYLDAIRTTAASLYNKALEDSGKSIFLDKTPRYYFILPELRRVFPEAKIIILLRNPIAVLASILNVWVPHGWWWEDDIILSYKHDLLTAPRIFYEELKDVHENTTIIRYEDLIADGSGTVKTICTDLGIDFQQEMMSYESNDEQQGLGDNNSVHKHTSIVTTYSDKWKTQLNDARQNHLAFSYLSLLGPELFNGLGYDFNELHMQLSNRTGDEEILSEKHLGQVDNVISKFIDQADVNAA